MTETQQSHLPLRYPPVWRRRGLLLLGLLLAILPAASPYIGQGEIPRTNDLLPHLFRTVALDLMVGDGYLWPRWSSDLVHGYGYPVFNFFPSLSHWVVEVFHLLGLPMTTAYRLVVGLHLWLAAIGAYGLGRLWLRPFSAWIVSIAYVYSPYMLYDIHIRGSLPEGQALALLPFLLLALWHTAFSKQYSVNSIQYSGNGKWYGGWWTAVLALLFAATLLSHPVIYPLMFPIGLWLLVLAGRHGWRTLIGPAVGLGGGVLLTAFLWLPALLEAQFTRAAVTADQGYNYRDNFLTLGQLLDWPRLPADPALINPPVVRALPVVALLLAAFLLVGWLWRRSPATLAQRHALFDWSLIFLASTYLMLPAARWVWDVVPLLPQTLFPWRFLALASLAGGLLLGLGADLTGFKNLSGLSKNAAIRRQSGLVVVLTAVIILTATPWLFPPQEPLAEAPTPADLAADEIPPFLIGTTTLGEYLPRWVSQLPDTTEMQANLLADRHFDRLQPQAGLTVLSYDGLPVNARYQLDVTHPVTLTYRQFYFPGWQATLNGQPIPLTPGQPHGLIETAVFPGQHSLHIHVGTTSARQAGGLLSGLGLLLILLILGLNWRQNKPNERLNNDSADITAYHFLLWGIVACGLWLLVANIDSPLRRDTLLPDGVYGQPQISPLDYAGELRLLTFTPQQISQPADQPIPLTLYWQPQRPIGVSYQVGVQLVDEQGIVWSRHAARPYNWRFVGNHPWPLDGYRMDPFEIELLDGTPPGQYYFLVGVVQEDTGQTIAAHEFGLITITEPMQGERPLEAGMIPPTDPAGPGLSLLGSRLDRREAAPGDPLRVALLWQIENPADLNSNQITLTLRDEAGAILLTRKTAVFPTNYNQPIPTGSRWRTELVTRLPASLPGGDHTWYAELETAVWPIGPLTINEPERTFTPPPLEHPVQQTVGDVATLLGATISNSSMVELVWRSEAETAVSYRVFLHLIGPDGQLVAQSDGEPAQWQRPTTGWLPGEIIIDPRHLPLLDQLPPGDYQLLAGLYDPTTGQRLTTADGSGALTITIPQK